MHCFEDARSLIEASDYNSPRAKANLLYFLALTYYQLIKNPPQNNTRDFKKLGLNSIISATDLISFDKTIYTWEAIYRHMSYDTSIIITNRTSVDVKTFAEQIINYVEFESFWKINELAFRDYFLEQDNLLKVHGLDPYLLNIEFSKVRSSLKKL